MNPPDEHSQLTLTIGPAASDLSDAVLAIQSFLTEEESENESILLLAFRELVNNALDHGNKRDPSLTATAILERERPGQFLLTVKDQGEGFDHQALDMTMPGADEEHRRGLPLVNDLAEWIRFNEAGNQVTVELRLPQKTLFQIELLDDWQVIRPNTDIAGEAAENFRTTLLDLAQSGHGKFRFDLVNVAEIDSISLSLFVVFNNMLKKRGLEPELEIVNAQRDIARLFHMTRLSRFYRFPGQGA